MKWYLGVRRSCLAMVTTAFVMSAVHAQDNKLIEAARQYVKLPGVQRMFDEMFSPDAFANQVAVSLPPQVDATPEQLNEVGQLMADIMIPLRPEMEQTMITAAAHHFSLKELQALSRFYKSPEGASVMAKMQPFMQETMSGIMPRMMQASQELSPEINRILEIEQ